MTLLMMQQAATELEEARKLERAAQKQASEKMSLRQKRAEAQNDKKHSQVCIVA